jgi:hypothetical protein
VSWLKYLWATLIGFVVTVAVATSSAILILWLDLSRYVEPVSDGLVLGIDPGIWYGISLSRHVYSSAYLSEQSWERPSGFAFTAVIKTQNRTANSKPGY